MSTSLNTYKEDSIEALLELVRGGLKELFVRCKQRNVAPPLYGKTVYAPPESQVPTSVPLNNVNGNSVVKRGRRVAGR